MKGNGLTYVGFDPFRSAYSLELAIPHIAATYIGEETNSILQYERDKLLSVTQEVQISECYYDYSAFYPHDLGWAT